MRLRETLKGDSVLVKRNKIKLFTHQNEREISINVVEIRKIKVGVTVDCPQLHTVCHVTQCVVT